jgi:predicted O-methyltransferase YrrM
LSATRKLKEIELEFDDPNLSWHHHIFAALAGNASEFGACPRILEIGTFDGSFTRNLSLLFPNGHIITLDLPDSSPDFRLSYSRGKRKNFDSFLRRRAVNVDQPNVSFLQVSSSEIPRIFEGQVFDLIWIDGDHLDPQVSADIRNSLSLMHSGSYMLNDDVIIEPSTKENVSEAAFVTLNELQRDGRLENVFFLKRTSAEQPFLKFVVVSRKPSGDLAARA